MPLTEIEKVLTYIIVPLGIYVIGMGIHLFFEWRKESKVSANHPMAHKPTKKEIEERNFLLMSDEMEAEIERIKLDEHETALA